MKVRYVLRWTILCNYLLNAKKVNVPIKGVLKMTPKEKAEELLHKYAFALKSKQDDEGFFYNRFHAKECALLAVELLLDILPSINDEINYYSQVKLEIEKLWN